jgi:putative ABC transport system substrate-binding protein
MHKALGGFALCALLLAVSIPAEAQQPAKLHRIGYLAGASRSAIAFRTEAFRQGLRELGYVEGKNITVEYRYAEGNFRRQKELAAEQHYWIIYSCAGDKHQTTGAFERDCS